MVVPGIADVIDRHLVPLRKEFVAYSMTAVRVQSYVDERRNAFDDLLAKAASGSLFRGLPFLAYVLVPVQRVARYPLLVEVRHMEMGGGHREKGRQRETDRGRGEDTTHTQTHTHRHTHTHTRHTHTTHTHIHTQATENTSDRQRVASNRPANSENLHLPLC